MLKFGYFKKLEKFRTKDCQVYSFQQQKSLVLEGWMDGCKSRFKDSLQQSKIIIILLLKFNPSFCERLNKCLFFVSLQLLSSYLHV